MDPITAGLLGSAVIGGAASLFGGHSANRANERMARDANAAGKAQSQAQMAFQERMSNTAYQRQVADLKQAGLNPMLAYMNGGASSPAGASSAMQVSRSENIGKDAGDKIAGLGTQFMQKKLNVASENLLKAQAAQAAAATAKTLKETQLLELTKNQEQFWSALYGMPLSLVNSANKLFSTPMPSQYSRFSNSGVGNSKKGPSVEVRTWKEVMESGGDRSLVNPRSR